MKLRIIALPFLFILLFAFAAISKPVDRETALKAATVYYFERASQYQSLGMKDIGIASEYAEKDGNSVLYYIFNFSSGGWVIISADDRMLPIIGYSFKNSLEPGGPATNFNWWMEQISKQIARVLQEDLGYVENAGEEWDYLLTRDESNLYPFKGKDITPLMLSTWDQGKFYNAMCPVATGGPDGRALVGCVATAMSQVMFYYRWPVQGQGTHGGINLGTTYYRWNEMLNELTNYNTGVAQLCYHAGKTVNMSYGATGSAASSSEIPIAMLDHWRYNSAIKFELKWIYSTTNWQNKLKANLNLLRPVIYSGSDPSAGGHAWVCDGYQGNSFHMNWGWGGYGDGYFTVDNLSVAGNNFSNNQGGVFDIYPVSTGYPTYCTGTTNITYSSGTIADGSGHNNYQNNSSCSWLISPAETVTKITVKCNAIATEAGADVITIYDGDNTGATVLATWSGNTIPTQVQSSGDKVLVVFNTNSSNVGQGWQLEYISTYPVYCTGITTLTTATGSVDDGSGTSDYGYNQLCRWRIWPTGAGSITINFSQFNVASDDWLKLTDEANGTELVTLTGSSLPSQATYYTGKLLLTFKTNSTLNAAGWALTYTSLPVGVGENTLPGISVYPNPAAGKLFIDIASGNGELLDLELFTPEGRKVLQKQIHPGTSSHTQEVDVSNLPQGLYILHLKGNSGLVNAMIVIE